MLYVLYVLKVMFFTLAELTELALFITKISDDKINENVLQEMKPWFLPKDFEFRQISPYADMFTILLFRNENHHLSFNSGLYELLTL